MRGTILIVILVHTLSACYSICFPKTPGYGHCVELNQCNFTSKQQKVQCKSVQDTPLYCCPEKDIFKTVQWNNTQATLKFPLQCGETSMDASAHIRGGYVAAPIQFSWMASLQYNNEPTFGVCAGSVINSRYVLTAAHCAIGNTNRKWGNVTGVRLGDFDRNSSCDYGSATCKQYQHFGISNIIVHDKYEEGKFHYDIALLRLNRSITFTEKLRPICLPFNIEEPGKGFFLMLAGWGKSLETNSTALKRAVSIPLWDQKDCSQEPAWDEHQICAEESDRKGGGKGSCDGDSGGPLMHQFEIKRMVLEGIVSHGIGPCPNPYAASYFTRVRSFLKWLELQMYVD